MSKDTASNLFILPSMPRLYQQIISGVSSYEALGNRITKCIENACAFRQVERVRELSSILVNFPIKEYRLIGQYYLVWCDGRESKYNTKILMRIVEQTTTYKTKAMLSLGAFEIYQGKIESSLYYYTEALKTSPSVSDYIVLSRSVAAIKSDEGFHRLALRDLENLLPIIRYAEPQVYYDYLNSLAVELGEVGRIEEAQNVCRITLASPFINAYPEWRETWQDLALRGYKSRSVVSVLKPALDKDNVVPMPVVERSPDPPQQGSAKLFDLKKWAKKMGKKPNGNGKKLPENMTSRDMVVKLMNLTTQEGISDEKLQKIIDYVEKLLSEPD